MYRTIQTTGTDRTSWVRGFAPQFTCWKSSLITIILALLAIVPSHSLRAQTAAVEGYVDVYGAVSGRPTFLGYGPNYGVKFCSNTNGTACVATGTSDSTGFYIENYPPSSAGTYWVFVWNDTYHWGSSSVSIGQAQLGTFISLVTPVANPAPLVPTAIYPLNNSTTVPFNQDVTIKWTSGLDSFRTSSSWPATYDFYASAWGSPQTLVAANLPSPQYFLPNGSLEAATPYDWHVVAKLADNLPPYTTSSANYHFTTVAAPYYTIFTSQVPSSTIPSTNYEIATQFTSTLSGSISSLRFWQAAGETGSHTLRLWSDSGTLLKSVTIAAGGSTGWHEAALTPHVAIAAGVKYRVSYNTNTQQPKTPFAGYPINNGPLSATYGYYGQPAGAFPTIGSTSWYFADVKFSQNP